MSKYLQIFKISFAQEFAYKFNFVMWRVRNVMQILIFFFLWDAVFAGGQNQVFGYDRTRILTYAFVLIIVRAIILSSRSVDVASQIADGNLSNYLLKPVNFFRYWITRDVSSKILNIFFGVFEVTILVFFLKPPLFFQSNFFYILLFLLSIVIASFIFFCLSMLTNYISFWIPELHWGAQFLIVVVAAEYLSGAFFPIDVLPNTFYQLLRLTPFPYLIFFPIQIYLGNLSTQSSLQAILIGSLWAFVLWKSLQKVWDKGLKVYESVGK